MRRYIRRGRQLVRVLKVFVALYRTRFGVTFDELLEESRVSRRTLYRYLAALEEAGIRISSKVNGITGKVLRRVEDVDGRRIRMSA